MAACEFPLHATIWRTVSISGPGGIVYPFPRPSFRSTDHAALTDSLPSSICLFPSPLYPVYSGSLFLFPSCVPLTSLLPSSLACHVFLLCSNCVASSPTFSVTPSMPTNHPPDRLFAMSRTPSYFLSLTLGRLISLSRSLLHYPSLSDSYRCLSSYLRPSRMRGGRRQRIHFTQLQFYSVSSYCRPEEFVSIRRAALPVSCIWEEGSRLL